MNIQLSKFYILGLHGKLDIKIPIRDNKLILIGVNGLGKTTVVNFIYFVLTDQWSRLLDYEFSAIEMTINGGDFILTKHDIQLMVRSSEIQQRQLQRYSVRSSFPSQIIQRLTNHPLFKNLAHFPSGVRDELTRKISRDTAVSPTIISRMSAEIAQATSQDLFSETKQPSSIANLSTMIKNIGKYKVIYLPTYRRIEQDLKSVFPNIDDSELRKLTAASDVAFNARSKGHVELVQFGMQDVESKINDELEEIQKRTRSQLTALTGTYLQDIIRNRAGQVPREILRSIPNEAISIVLERVEENTLSAEDKREIEAAILRLKNNESHTDVRDSYLAYFFGRLLEIYQDLYFREENIRTLIKTCNSYLERKKLNYNDQDFSVEILDEDESPLEWKMLSSGEKQVASLFTHLYLSQEQSQIIIIDEPELSLSVPWQKNLLPDIVQANNCSLLIAVTHSPFIYSNELDPYAVDLGGMITPTNS
ncbi:AAA family ATPase [Bordetella genomosp. 6]|nr:AAA family ATPase [Bordetella genomosp. 6]